DRSRGRSPGARPFRPRSRQRAPRAIASPSALARSPAGDYRRSVAVGAFQQGSVELRSFVERYLAAWNGCDTDAMAQLITEDIVWADPALPEPARGVPAVQEFMRASTRAFPDLHFGEPDPPVLALDGDVVMWAWCMQGTKRAARDP